MEENMKLAKLDFTEPPLLTDDEIEEVLIRIDELVLWADSVKDYALKEALKGKIGPNLNWSKESQIASSQMKQKLQKSYTKQVLIRLKKDYLELLICKSYSEKANLKNYLVLTSLNLKGSLLSFP